MKYYEASVHSYKLFTHHLMSYNKASIINMVPFFPLNLKHLGPRVFFNLANVKQLKILIYGYIDYYIHVSWRMQKLKHF